MEASADSLCVDPNLPLASFSVPRLANVVPLVQPNWIVESIDCLAIDSH